MMCLRASGSIKINLTEVRVLGEQWKSTVLVDTVDSLNKNTTDANAGALKGNRMFYDNDYMVWFSRDVITSLLTSLQVHRGPGYVTSVKMYSTRSKNTECTNTQNVSGNLIF